MRAEKMNTEHVPARRAETAAANQVMQRLTKISAPQVRGAHDADFVIVSDKAYVVYEANDIQPGENAEWPFIYAVLCIVDIHSNTVEDTIGFAASEMHYENETLPAGACFVPRILQKSDTTLRCFFSSENPGIRESQTWYIDFVLAHRKFSDSIYKAKLQTEQGIFDMQPCVLYDYAAARGFKGTRKDFGLFAVDSFKKFDNRIYAVLNNFPIGQNALTVLNGEQDTFEVLGSYHEPLEMKLTESAVNRLPDGTWLVISRREDGDKNYVFAQSRNGRDWTPHTVRQPVTNGTNSKPTLDRFNGKYYLGWQEAAQIDGVSRSVFNIEVSADGEHWERAYRFESEKSFQYPVFKEYAGSIYLAVTQGDWSDSRKEFIMFGKLE
jgi:hypothetical protein